MSSRRPTSVPAGLSTGARKSCVSISRRLSLIFLVWSSLISLPLTPLIGPIMPPLFECLPGFRNQPHQQGQCRHVLGPPPAEPHAREQAGQRDRGEVGAAHRLSNVSS